MLWYHAGPLKWAAHKKKEKGKAHNCRGWIGGTLAYKFSESIFSQTLLFSCLLPFSSFQFQFYSIRFVRRSHPQTQLIKQSCWFIRTSSLVFIYSPISLFLIKVFVFILGDALFLLISFRSVSFADRWWWRWW